MLMKICIAAAVALGCTLAVPGASFAQADKGKSATTAQGDKDKSATSTTAAVHHKKPKKGHADEVHSLPKYTGGTAK